MTTTTLRAATADGHYLYVEVTGEGPPVLFIHEFAGDHRSWEPQVRAMARRHTCITYGARGYPPSDVPEDPTAYSQDHAVSDALAVADAVGVEQLHVVGLSMGGFCALHLALRHPERVASAVIGGVGYGALPEKREAFRQECEVIAVAYESEGAERVAERYAFGPARVQFENKDPRGHAEFARMLAEHSSEGAARTMRGFQKERPSLYDFRDDLARMETPLLILVGDEDEGAIEPSVMLKRTVPTAGLAVLPRSGHTLNLEEPEKFNRLVLDFIADVEAGRWGRRDPRSLATSTTGMND